VFFRRGEQAREAALQVGGLRDVGLGLSILGAEQEHSRRCGDGVEELGIALRRELKRTHKRI